MQVLRRAVEIEQMSDSSEIWSALVQTLATEGLTFVNYITSDADRKNVELRTTCPALYESRAADCDPFLLYCCNTYAATPTGSDHVDDYPHLSLDDRMFILKAGKLGFRTGLGIPMRLFGAGRFGGFNIGADLPRAEFAKRFHRRSEELRFFLMLVHRRFEELSGGGPVKIAFDLTEKKFASLSPREAEVLSIVTSGVTQKECARICGISHYTVAEYLKSAYRKLGVRNRVEAAHIIANHKR